jgi:hypothetical protein
VQAKLDDYRLCNHHLDKSDPLERNKIMVFNETNTYFANDWEWSIFDTFYKNNEEVPVDSK